MNDVIEVFDDLLRPIYQPLLPYLMPALIVTVVTVIVVAFGLPWLIRVMHRLFTRTPRPLHKAKQELLANGKITELYAPAQRYTRELREKERPRQWAGLSPFPVAARESVRRNNTPHGQKLDANKQIRAASKRVKVRKPHENDCVAGDPLMHFRIDFALDGHTEKEIKDLADYVKSSLQLKEIKLHQTGSQAYITFIAHKEEAIDILTQRSIGASFLAEHKPNNPYSVILAVGENGKPVVTNVAHTLIAGASGSGKGSPIQDLIFQQARFVGEGIVQLHGIDPKKAELKGYEVTNSSLFKKITSGLKDDDMREHGEHISEILEILDHRMNSLRVSVKKGSVNMQRSVPATKETPMVIVIIDEYLTLYRGFKKLGREGAVYLSNLEQLIATGRSYGIYLMVATQRADKEVLGELRDNMANVVLLRYKSDWINGLFLGEDAKENGFDAGSIQPATKGNGYATAGIGFVTDESGEPVKMRYAYLSDDDIAELISDFELEYGRGEVSDEEMDEFHKVMELPSLNDDFLFEDDENTEDDGDFKIEELPTLSDD